MFSNLKTRREGGEKFFFMFFSMKKGSKINTYLLSKTSKYIKKIETFSITKIGVKNTYFSPRLFLSTEKTFF